MRTEVIPMAQLAQLLEIQLEQGAAPLRVTGSSMRPTFRDGLDTVFLHKPDTALRKGDVILYLRENGKYVLHRIVRLHDEELICSGDNQYEPERVEMRQVIARVEAFRRGVKEYPVSHLGYRAYVWFWVGLFPIRKPILKLRRRLGRLRKRFAKNVQEE